MADFVSHCGKRETGSEARYFFTRPSAIHCRGGAKFNYAPFQKFWTRIIAKLGSRVWLLGTWLLPLLLPASQSDKPGSVRHPPPNRSVGIMYPKILLGSFSRSEMEEIR